MSVSKNNINTFDIENKLHNNQQAVESHISRITELQRMIESEEALLSDKISKSQRMVEQLISKYNQEH